MANYHTELGKILVFYPHPPPAASGGWGVSVYTRRHDDDNA